MAKRSSYARAKSRRERAERRAKKRFNQIAAIVVAVVAVVAIALSIALYQPSDSQQKTALPRDISVQQAYQFYNEGYFLLDVRTQEEWDAGHVPNATLIPLDQLPNRLGELPQDQPILVICRSGNRSQVGRDILLQNGFNATSITGGINAWISAGYPVVKP